MNLYEGQNADARQGGEDVPPSLFRKRYRQLSESEVALHDEIKGKADELALLITSIVSKPQPMKPAENGGVLDNLAVNQGANVTLALRHLEDAVYRAVKALTT